MTMFTAIISIVVITGLVELANRTLFLRFRSLPGPEGPSGPRTAGQAFRVCPICAAVSGTWFWLTAAGLYGLIDWSTFQPIVLLLMGGTVVGVAYQGEKSLPWAGRYPVAWKTAVVIIGMPLVFWAGSKASLAVLVLEAVVLLALVYLFFIRRPSPQAEQPSRSIGSSGLEEKLKDCC